MAEINSGDIENISKRERLAKLKIQTRNLAKPPVSGNCRRSINVVNNRFMDIMDQGKNLFINLEFPCNYNFHQILKEKCVICKIL